MKKTVYATHITTPAGKRVYLRAKTKEELDEKVLEARIALRAGVDIASNLTFEEYARVWLRAYKLGKVRPSSYTILETNLNTHVIPFFAGMKLKEIKPLHIQLFISSLDGYSKSLQTKCISLARNIFQSAAENVKPADPGR